MIEQEIIKWIIAFVMGGITGFVSTYRKKNKELLLEFKERNEKLNKAVQSLLRDRLIEKYRIFKIKGEMTILDKENIDALFKEYEGLGGNGTMKELMEDLEHTKIKIINIKE